MIIHGRCAATTSSAWSVSGASRERSFSMLIITINGKTVKANKRGGIEMVPWWVAIMMLIGGVVLGLFMAALLIADERDDRP